MASGEGGTLAARLRAVAATLAGIAETRLALAATELEEERLRLARLLVLGAAAAFAVALGIVLVCAFVIAAFWDGHRLLAIALLALGCFAAAGLAWWRSRRLLRERPALLGATLEVLRRDAAALRGARAGPPP